MRVLIRREEPTRVIQGKKNKKRVEKEEEREKGKNKQQIRKNVSSA